jgi:hypothetical protein
MQQLLLLLLILLLLLLFQYQDCTAFAERAQAQGGADQGNRLKRISHRD